MWTETIRTLDDIDEMAFPRIAAAAEAAWSPATGASDLRTWESFRERVGALGPLWTSLGIGFHAVGRDPLGDRVSTIIHSVRLVGAAPDGESSTTRWVRFDGRPRRRDRHRRRLARIAAADDASSTPPPSPGPGALLTPGFIDIHGHGGGGRVVRRRSRRDPRRARAAPRARHDARRRLARDGAARDARAAGRDGRRPRRDGCRHPRLASRGAVPRPGAQGRPRRDAAARRPSPPRVERLLEAGRGTVRQVTLAPELPGALDAIRLVVGAGAAAAVGHTGADFAACRAAFDAGATILTHAFNAMPRPAPPGSRSGRRPRHPIRA